MHYAIVTYAIAIDAAIAVYCLRITILSRHAEPFALIIY